jgi:hypothetical protein
MAHQVTTSTSVEVTESSFTAEDERWAEFREEATAPDGQLGHQLEESSLLVNLSDHANTIPLSTSLSIVYSHPQDVGTFGDLSGDFCELVIIERHRRFYSRLPWQI